LGTPHAEEPFGRTEALLNDIATMADEFISLPLSQGERCISLRFVHDGAFDVALTQLFRFTVLA
jgi:hypothetical protein